ncbi:hypothetical protein [Rhodoplanes roseus]|uniref:Molecular chaperone DnaJ n=1 Tax=Rhodoplanes roseus TaxID=29409 RepID=A0A327L8Q1_9BRAD|nr:hypothetical protein [Rhodoplanes roseus]RAI45882.1 hypothetical protein CH341_01780 [Rhodoplanes roseus]
MAADPKATPSGLQTGQRPGDEADPGTPGTGEALCPDCDGTGKQHGRACPTCGGTGKVVQGIGGA